MVEHILEQAVATEDLALLLVMVVAVVLEDMLAMVVLRQIVQMQLDQVDLAAVAVEAEEEIRAYLIPPAVVVV